MTLTFIPEQDIDLGFSRASFEIATSIGIEWKESEQKQCWTHTMTLMLDPPMISTLDFQDHILK